MGAGGNLPKVMINSGSFIVKSTKSIDAFKRNGYKPINLSISAVQKRILEGRKKILLKQFEVNDEKMKELLLVKNSPTSNLMKQIIYYMTKRNIENGYDVGSYTHKPKVTSMKYNKTFPKTFGKIYGNRPCARDGHTSIIINNKMVVFGGNRHRISFNDVYELDLDKLSEINH